MNRLKVWMSNLKMLQSVDMTISEECANMTQYKRCRSKAVWYREIEVQAGKTLSVSEGSKCRTTGKHVM